MLGIPDFFIISVFVLCILSAIFCVIYGVLNWNKGSENESEEIKEELTWQEEENKIEELL